LALLAVAGCRPSEPPPTYNEDLGTDDVVLLPTSSAWYDPAVAKGQADWRPFRKPGAESKSDETATGEVKPAGGNKGVESELRTLVNDFNAAVAENKFEDAITLLVEDQVDTAKQVVELLPAYLNKLREVVEVLPGDTATMKSKVAAATLPAVLKLDVATISISSATEAVGKHPSASSPAEDVRFVLVKESEGEYWYIDNPKIRALAPALPMLQQSLPQLDAFIAGVKSGQISAEALTQQTAMMNQLLGSMAPPDSQPGAEPAKGEPEKDAKPEEGG